MRIIIRKQWVASLLASLALVTLAAFSPVPAIPARENLSPAIPRPSSFNLARPQGPTVYDEQLACSFTQNVPSLSYTITANSQSGTDGYGPAYLVNGLGSSGYWYQVGLSYNWNLGAGFALNYEVFDTRGNSIFPANGGGGLTAFSPVNSGDTIVLSLTISGGSVLMQGTDQTSGAHAQEIYSAQGATTFVGTPSAVASPAGFWTGLMTEWYHTAPYYGDEQKVTYTDNGAPIASAWLWMEELTVSQNGITGKLFSAESPSPLTFTNPAAFQTLTSNGATESINATQFVTGGLVAPVPSVPLSFSYSVTGGVGASSAPVLTYVSAGAQKTATLSGSGQAFTADSGSAWSVTNPLTGSTATERWQTAQPASGTAASSLAAALVFYHQYNVTFNFTISGGGSGYSPPVALCQQFGKQVTPPFGAQAWVDAAPYSFSNPLAGSSSSERWNSDAPAGTVSAAGNIAATYDHQYYVTINPAPAIGGTVSAATGWFDAGASLNPQAAAGAGWQFEGWLGSGDGSFSGAANPALLVVSSALSETANFYPGLSIGVSGNGSVAYSMGTRSGGVATGTSQIIYAGPGATVQLTAKSGGFLYKFTGWKGASSSNQSNISITLDTPMSVTADFSYNWVVLGVGGGVVMVIIAGVIILVARRRSRQTALP